MPGSKSKFFDEGTAAHAIETTLEKDRLTCVRNSLKHPNREELTRPFGFFLGENSDIKQTYPLASSSCAKFVRA